MCLRTSSSLMPDVMKPGRGIPSLHYKQSKAVEPGLVSLPHPCLCAPPPPSLLLPVYPTFISPRCQHPTKTAHYPFSKAWGD